MAGKLKTCCCACEEGCVSGSTIEVTLAGIDATMCSGCISLATDLEVTNLDIDGVYSVGGFATLPTPGECRWDDDITPGPYVDLDIYSSSDGSCTTISLSATGTIMNIVIDYDTANSRFNFVSIQPAINANNTQAFRYFQGTDGGSFDFGDAIPNSTDACSSTSFDAYSDGGTVTVNCE